MRKCMWKKRRILCCTSSIELTRPRRPIQLGQQLHVPIVVLPIVVVTVESNEQPVVSVLSASSNAKPAKYSRMYLQYLFLYPFIYCILYIINTYIRENILLENTVTSMSKPSQQLSAKPKQYSYSPQELITETVFKCSIDPIR